MGAERALDARELRPHARGHDRGRATWGTRAWYIDAHLIRYTELVSPGTLIRTVRRSHHLTQAQLAVRGGTSQNAISRIERDQLSPSVDTLRRLLAVMGEQLELSAHPLAGDFDPDHLADSLAQAMDERLERSFAWNRFGEQLTGIALAGKG